METKLKGLCSTCRFSDECHSQKNHKQAVLFCEEFEIESVERAYQQAAKPRNSKSYTGIEGLCQNCVNAESCNHKKPTIVVHCNEYRVR